VVHEDSLGVVSESFLWGDGPERVGIVVVGLGCAAGLGTIGRGFAVTVGFLVGGLTTGFATTALVVLGFGLGAAGVAGSIAIFGSCATGAALSVACGSSRGARAAGEVCASRSSGAGSWRNSDA
jgi:hypothetical protein